MKKEKKEITRQLFLSTDESKQATQQSIDCVSSRAAFRHAGTNATHVTAMERYQNPLPTALDFVAGEATIA